MVIAGLRNRRAAQMVGQVEVGILDPFRSANIERVRAQHLPAPGDGQHTLLNAETRESSSGSGPSITDTAPSARLTCGSESSASRKLASRPVRCSTANLRARRGLTIYPPRDPR